MNQHTPGPWELSVFSKHDGTPLQTAEDVAETVAASCRHHDVAELWGVTIAGTDVVIAYTGNGPTREANARLIAESPTMFALLERLVVEFSGIGTGLGLQETMTEVERLVRRVNEAQ